MGEKRDLRIKKETGRHSLCREKVVTLMPSFV